jgi:hypothetical protein
MFEPPRPLQWGGENFGLRLSFLGGGMSGIHELPCFAELFVRAARLALRGRGTVPLIVITVCRVGGVVHQRAQEL